jgi:hypothetical protein
LDSFIASKAKFIVAIGVLNSCVILLIKSFLISEFDADELMIQCTCNQKIINVKTIESTVILTRSDNKNFFFLKGKV